MQKVWPNTIVEEANLTVNVSALRKALGSGSGDAPYIETVPKKGYRFVAAVTEVPGTAACMDEDDTQIPSADPVELARAPHVQRRFLFAAAAVIVTLTGLIASYFVFRSGQTSTSTALKPPAPRTLAVLPFLNLEPDHEADFLGFALADAVITKLGYVSEITVRPSYSVQRYIGFKGDMQRLAFELNVDTLLTGTFVREGEDLRIACQLVASKSQSILWKGVFDLKYQNLRTLQDRVAGQIIKGLEVTLSPSEAARLAKRETVDPAGYEYFLRGVDLYARSDFATAIQMLEKAVDAAPEYPPAWAYLGKAYTANASFQFGGADAYRKAQRAFERALALEPDQLDARIYMANMFTDTGRVERSVPLLREALKTNPNHAECHWELSYAFRFGGLLSESVSEAERARQIDPQVKLNSSAINGYLYLGQYDRFLQSLPKSDDSALVTFYRGFGEYHRKNLKAALEHFDRAEQLDHSLLHSQIGKALGFGIRKEPFRGIGILKALEAKIRQKDVGDAEARYKIAQSYAVLGDHASALRVLKDSIGNGFFPYPYLLTDPLLDRIRSRREFTQLLAQARQRHQEFAEQFSPQTASATPK